MLNRTVPDASPQLALTGGERAKAESWRRHEGVRRRIVGVFNASTSPPKEGYAVTETNVFELTQPGTFSDPLTEVLRNGARTLLGQAVEAEVAAWLSSNLFHIFYREVSCFS
jgi:hypothetical protein